MGFKKESCASAPRGAKWRFMVFSEVESSNKFSEVIRLANFAAAAVTARQHRWRGKTDTVSFEHLKSIESTCKLKYRSLGGYCSTHSSFVVRRVLCIVLWFRSSTFHKGTRVFDIPTCMWTYVSVDDHRTVSLQECIEGLMARHSS
jgi:hypothetical protein